MSPKTTKLTERQDSILLTLADGMNNIEIAAELGVSAETIKTHMQELFTKFGARNRTHLVALAYHRGYLKPSR